MQNLEQIRAHHVIQFAAGNQIAGANGGEVIKKIPPLIINHGLLATVAYSFREAQGWQTVFDAIASHLADERIGILPANQNTRHQMMAYLTNPQTTSSVLKLATTETMAWLSYARRFVNAN